MHWRGAIRSGAGHHVRLRVAAAGDAAEAPLIALRFQPPSGDLATNEADEEHSYRLRVDAEVAVVEAAYGKGIACGTSELLAFVAYGDARGVTLIPEIELPGHSSRLRESGYLPGAASDRDVADVKHFARIAALLDDVMEVRRIRCRPACATRRRSPPGAAAPSAPASSARTASRAARARGCAPTTGPCASRCRSSRCAARRDRDGVWGKGECLIANTPTSEEWQEASVQLVKGEAHRLRVDHRNALPRPVLMVGWRGGAETKWLDITLLLRPLVD